VPLVQRNSTLGSCTAQCNSVTLHLTIFETTANSQIILPK